ncbi:hypothetical protein BKA62DRAFT_589270, partial [Auriculariales sp. MPI-PUGE-AT-0066]
PVTDSAVSSFILHLGPLKAPGFHGTRNIALQKCPSLIPILRRLTQSCLSLHHFPSVAKEFITCVLRKPGKDDYSKPGAWRPVALEDSESKVVEGIVAAQLVELAERCDLLPDHQFG